MDTEESHMSMFFVIVCEAHFSLRFLVFLVGLDHLNYTGDIGS